MWALCQDWAQVRVSLDASNYAPGEMQQSQCRMLFVLQPVLTELASLIIKFLSSACKICASSSTSSRNATLTIPLARRTSGHTRFPALRIMYVNFYLKTMDRTNFSSTSSLCTQSSVSLPQNSSQPTQHSSQPPCHTASKPSKQSRSASPKPPR